MYGLGIVYPAKAAKIGPEEATIATVIPRGSIHERTNPLSLTKVVRNTPKVYTVCFCYSLV